jgi:hypothetical protein
MYMQVLQEIHRRELPEGLPEIDERSLGGSRKEGNEVMRKGKRLFV